MRSSTANCSSPRPFATTFTRTLTFLVIAAVVLLSLAPFGFSAETKGGPRLFLSAATSHVTVLDATGNVALYVLPGLGFFLCARRRCARLVSVGIAIVAAAILSLTLESLQAWVPPRVSSLIDVVSNGMGAALGIAIACWMESMIPRLVGTVLYEIRTRPAATALKAYAALLFVFAVLPFTFASDVQQVGKSYRAATWIPFSTPPAVREMLADATPDSLNRRGDVIRMMVMRRWGRWAAQAVSFALLALLLRRVLRDDYGFARGAATALTLWLGGLWAAVLGLLQFVVASSTPDAGDFVVRILGLAGGLVACQRLSWRRAGGPGSAGPLTFAGFLRIACPLCAIYVLYQGLIPFDFHWNERSLPTVAASPALHPFVAYAAARLDAAWADMAEKLAAFAVLGALFTAASMARQRHVGHGNVGLVLLGCLALAGGIELVQVFLPIRVPSLTDPFVAAVGCLAGTAVATTAASLVRFANHAQLVDPTSVVPLSSGRRLGPVDELIASLADPDPNAPPEDSPAHPARRR